MANEDLNDHRPVICVNTATRWAIVTEVWTNIGGAFAKTAPCRGSYGIGSIKVLKPLRLVEKLSGHMEVTLVTSLMAQFCIRRHCFPRSHSSSCDGRIEILNEARNIPGN